MSELVYSATGMAQLFIADSITRVATAVIKHWFSVLISGLTTGSAIRIPAGDQPHPLSSRIL